MTFKQPESFQELSYTPDEIPGLSTFIYSENRFREPWEFIKQEGSYTLDVKALQDRVAVLKVDVKNKQQLYLEAKEEAYNLSCEIKDAELKHKESVQKAENDRHFWAVEATQYRNWMLKFADHTEDCDWIDFVQSGRVVKNKEQAETEKCNCGLAIAKNHVSNPVEACGPRFHLSAPMIDFHPCSM